MIICIFLKKLWNMLTVLFDNMLNYETFSVKMLLKGSYMVNFKS